MRRRAGNEHERLAGIVFRPAEVCGAIRCIESDGGFFGRWISNRGKPTPCPMPPACRIDHNVALDQPHVAAANSAYDAITANQFSNRSAVLKSNVGTCSRPPTNDRFEET